MKSNNRTKVMVALLASATLFSFTLPVSVHAQSLDASYSGPTVTLTNKSLSLLIEPVMGPHGFFVDVYHSNTKHNQTPSTNAVIGVLSEMLEVFTPGIDTSEGAADRWKTGTVLNNQAHMENIQKSKEIAESATEDQVKAAYLVDRRNQNYSSIMGLGNLTVAFKEGIAADTTIADAIPEDATTVSYDDEAQWADLKGQYADIAKLVEWVREGSASTNPSKSFFQYARPFRWHGIDPSLPEVSIQPILDPVKKPEDKAVDDGGYPSGHTNASYLASLSMAYAVPEQMHSLLLNASELGNSRIVAGMHSAFDVIGGRMSATAIATANLADEGAIEAKDMALAAGKQLIADFPDATLESSIYDEQPDLYQQHRQLYLDRMTYGISPDEATDEAAHVPKGAEVLLESRFPYLDAEQRRYILLTTATQSGHPIANDAEGFGRLNLFDAASGYGSFVQETMINMDASLGGFNTYDTFRNDIDGTGSLIKAGTGVLALTGNNTYSGNTMIEGGEIIARSNSALGTGHVENQSILRVVSQDGLTIRGDLNQSDQAEVIVEIDSSVDKLTIDGNVNGKIRLVIAEDLDLAEEGMEVISLSEGFDPTIIEIVVEGKTDSIELVETETGYQLQQR